MRLDKSPGKSTQDLLAKLVQQPPGLTWVSNLGHMNVFPVTSGKETLAQYLMQHFGSSPEESFLLCDDANDVGEHCTRLAVCFACSAARLCQGLSTADT